MELPNINKRCQQLIEHFAEGSRNAFADMVGVSQGTINRLFHEDVRYNKVPTPSDNTIEKILRKLPEVSRDWLLTGKGEMLNKPVQTTNQPIRTGEPIPNKHGNQYYELPNGKFMIEAPLVPFTAYASFIEVFDDEYQTNIQFETAYFSVDHVGRGRYVAFNVTNDSMNDNSLTGTPSGAEVLGRELQRSLWQDGFNPTKYGWIIITKTGIMHKDIVKDMNEKGNITLHSRNPSPEYADFEFPINDVHSIFKVIKRTY